MSFNFLKKLFKNNKAIEYKVSTLLDIKEVDDELLNIFEKLTSEQRIRNVIYHGDSGKKELFPLLKWVIFYDHDRNAKFAALKRIHLFKDNPDLITVLSELPNHVNTRELEPYYSMALSRVGIISLDDFKERIQDAK
ncbi:hypothetical protein [Mucilaginibacter ginsenosidivorax]|uniref:HEAT repeat domain-containing protein n=1 Tax=Mucilaginibacter ginsenosidivorax TaxID=862126 RepID=A0A5B8W534_9SPHI|nr:hypothetical protein [Mucilaginibacter ginsenosidivorax]QEC78042.1 hypothetical protein FSB76_19640 [Mucilaginibacter ginsenosidivorax]